MNFRKCDPISHLKLLSADLQERMVRLTDKVRSDLFGSDCDRNNILLSRGALSKLAWVMAKYMLGAGRLLDPNRGADLVWSPTGAICAHASGVQEASPEGWQEISPGWSASDTRGCSFNANRTPEGCEDNLDMQCSRWRETARYLMIACRICVRSVISESQLHGLAARSEYQSGGELSKSGFGASRHLLLEDASATIQEVVQRKRAQTRGIARN
jgi:ribosomal protein S14